MTKTRVNRGEKYYLVNTTLGTLSVDYLRDWRTSEDDAYYASGNYFHTEEEAEDMAKKLRTVLNGADVIEMPSKEDITDKIFSTAGEVVGCEGEITVSHCMRTAKTVVDWLKSKIVK